MKNILTLGEPLLINYLEDNLSKGICDSKFCFGGSEFNTAISLKKLGCNPIIISAIPYDKLGVSLINILALLDIETKFIIQDDEHIIGSMYVFQNDVIYHRKNSAFSKINIDDYDFNNIYNYKLDWLHLTGITPMLSVRTKNFWEHLIVDCSSKKIPISIDLNYRPKLGTFDYLWNLVKKYIENIYLIIFSINDLIKICNSENLEYKNRDIGSILTSVCLKYNLNMGIVCVKTKKNIGDIQYRNSYMYYNQQVYTSDMKEHEPKEDIGGGDSYIACIINGLLESDPDMKCILDEADMFTIKKQENRGNFNLS